MSKINLKLSYKNCCILKHALERSIELKEINVRGNECINKIRSDVVSDKQLKYEIKELRDERRVLKDVYEQIENWKTIMYVLNR